MAKLVTVCTLLSMAVAIGWELHQMDVHNAFLHHDLPEEVYIKLSLDFHPSQIDKVFFA